MNGDGRHLLLAICTVAVACLVTPGALQGQSILKRVKDQAAKRVAEGRAKIDSTVMKTTGNAVDSAVSKTNRGADAAAGRVTNVANGALSATERGVAKAFGGSASKNDLATRLAAGRVVLDDVRFVAGADQLDPSSDATLKSLAAALVATTGTFLIEGHTDVSVDPALAQPLSQQRASTVKARLVATGVPAERLLAVGYGATRPNSANPQASARIEVVRAQ
jgi:outer membrane protein OmpA-like peptidoglycan-associated protein